MRKVDWQVSIGFSPRQAIDASPERVFSMVSSHTITHLFLHNLKGLWYDPLEGNAELLRQYPAPISFEKMGQGETDVPVIFPVCTVNPLEGIDRATQVVSAGLEKGVRFWRLYPQEQQWAVTHPVCTKILQWLHKERCVLLLDASPSNVEMVATQFVGSLPIVTSFHYYDSADWLLRFQHSSKVFVTTRNLHGPGTIAHALADFSERLVYCSGAPFGSPASSALLVEDIGLQQQIFETNSTRLIRSVYRDY